MKVLLIQPSGGFQLRGTTHPICRSILLSATFLKENGNEVLLCDRCIEKPAIKKLVNKFKPDIAGVFLAHTSSVNDAIKISNELKAHNVTVVWCEMFAALGVEKAFETGCFDYALISECCVSFLNLINALKNKKPINTVKGLAYLENGLIVRTQPQELPELREMPVIDWTLTKPKKCFRAFPGCKKMLYLFSSVGCPYNCGFCYCAVYFRHTRRKRPIEYVLSEIDYLIDEEGLDGVNFSDELLLFTDTELDKIKQFRESKNNSFIWGGETRPTLFNRTMLEKMFAAGCRWLLFGLESGSDSMREAINKSADDEQIRQIVDICTDIGIATYGSFIIGFPNETKEDLKSTVKFALSLNLDAFLVNYFIPVMGSPLFEQLCNSGSFSVDDIRQYERMMSPDNYDINFSQVPKRDLAVIKSYFDFLTITRRKNTYKNPNSNVGREFVKKALNTMWGYFKGSPFEAIQNIAVAVKRGASVFLYPLIFKKTVREYGLYNVNKQSREEKSAGR